MYGHVQEYIVCKQCSFLHEYGCLLEEYGLYVNAKWATYVQTYEYTDRSEYSYVLKRSIHDVRAAFKNARSLTHHTLLALRKLTVKLKLCALCAKIRS